MSATRRALLAAARQRLAAASDSADADARLLFQAATGLSHAALIADPDGAVEPAAAARFLTLIERREAGEPVARILGRREFWGLDFTLGPDTLVPRPDTETLVEAALDVLAPRRDEALRIVDFGTGSGAILVALLRELPRAFGLGVDLSPGAAMVAAANARSAGVAGRAAFLVGNWDAALCGEFDLVVSNPPYIPSSHIPSLSREVREHDPLLALDGGADGLTAYRELARAAVRLLRPQGWLVLELGIGQEEDVRSIVTGAGLRCDAPARRDLAGIARALMAQREIPAWKITNEAVACAQHHGR